MDQEKLTALIAENAESLGRKLMPLQEKVAAEVAEHAQRVGDEIRKLEFEDYPWAKDADERARWFVFDTLAESADISALDGKILVQNMNCIYEWIKDRVVPGSEKKSKISPLKAVTDEPRL